MLDIDSHYKMTAIITRKDKNYFVEEISREELPLFD